MSLKDLTERLWAKDPYLWSTDSEVQKKIQNRLGWLTAPRNFLARSVEITNWADQVVQDEFQSVVLLGMGGSSLAPEVFTQTFRSGKRLPLVVVDTTDPTSISILENSLDLERTLFLVSTKSGSTIETLSLFRYFYQQTQQNGSQFVAITDPNSKLVNLARQYQFRQCFLNPVDIGGRYSVLSYFGLIPAALIGIDIEQLLNTAISLDWQSAVKFGQEITDQAQNGRDKMTLISSPPIYRIGCWIEQLIAESTGKFGQGIIPIDMEPLHVPQKATSSDRFFVYTKLAVDDSLESHVSDLKRAGFPVYEHELPDLYSLGSIFLFWQIATAIAGAKLGINPFDEPNVTESKNQTTKLLNNFPKVNHLPEEVRVFGNDKLEVYSTSLLTQTSINACLSTFLNLVQNNDYIGLMIYSNALSINEDGLPNRMELFFERMRKAINRICGTATTLGYGPRYLHSTGQLHKGGANNGHFIQITVGSPKFKIQIPATSYDFWTLKMAQAYGDLSALLDKGRQVIRIHLNYHHLEMGIQQLTEEFEQL